MSNTLERQADDIGVQSLGWNLEETRRRFQAAVAKNCR